MSLQTATFGGIDISQWLTGLNIERSVLPEVELTTVEVPAADGDVVAGRRLRAMEIRIVATLKGHDANTVNGYRKLLAAALSNGGTLRGTLVLPDETGVAYDAYVDGPTVLDRGYDNPHVTITFHVPSGSGYGTTQRTATIGTSSTTVTRGGNARSWPIVTATPASGTTAWRITNASTGRYVEATGAFDGTRQLVIDMDRQTVLYGNNSCVFALASDFFALERSTQQLAATSQATMTWHERWL